MTSQEIAKRYAEKLVTARDGYQAAVEIAKDISTLVWDEPGKPRLTYEEKIELIELVKGIVLAPNAGGKIVLGTDNSRTLELIRAVRQLVK